MNTIKGKLIIEANLELLSGLHIGTSNDFAPIGSVDSMVIRNAINNQPVINGSIKGKMRYLGARIQSGPILKDFKDEPIILKRLYGSSTDENGNGIAARLQFYDLKLQNTSIDKLKKADLDIPYTEIKFENTINRATAVANPRQLERVPAGAEFGFKLVYNIESIEEMDEDLKFLKQTMELLEADYLGGHGTRGYGRVKFEKFSIKCLNYSDDEMNEENFLKYFE